MAAEKLSLGNGEEREMKRVMEEDHQSLTTDSLLGRTNNEPLLRLHHGNRIFRCKLCNKRFPSSQALGGHQNAHRRERAMLKMANKRSQLFDRYGFGIGTGAGGGGTLGSNRRYYSSYPSTIPSLTTPSSSSALFPHQYPGRVMGGHVTGHVSLTPTLPLLRAAAATVGRARGGAMHHHNNNNNNLRTNVSSSPSWANGCVMTSSWGRGRTGAPGVLNHNNNAGIFNGVNQIPESNANGSGIIRTILGSTIRVGVGNNNNNNNNDGNHGGSAPNDEELDLNLKL